MSDATKDENRPAREEQPEGEGEASPLDWLRQLKKEREEQHEAQRRTEATTVRFTKQAAERLQRHAERLGISLPRYVEVLCTYRDPGAAEDAQELLSKIRAAAFELEETLSKGAPPSEELPYEQLRERVADLRRRTEELGALHGKDHQADGPG